VATAGPTSTAAAAGSRDPGAPARRFAVPPDLYPFADRWLEAAGCRVHYVDEGTGPPLLLLHGNPTWSFLYREVIGALRGDFRCLAPDLPGFGLSEPGSGYGFTPREHARVLEGFVTALDLRGLTLMAHDWGGPTGLWVAGRHPERIDALVIANTWAWPVSDDPHFRRFSRFMGGPVGGLLIRRLNAFVNVLLPACCARRKPRGELMRAYRAPFADPRRRTPMHVLPREICASEAFLAEVEAGLAALREKPVLLVWGERDFAFRARERERWERLFPACRTLRLPEAGHYVQEDAPAEVAAAIRAWHGERTGKAAARPAGSAP
jgi:haloalkane dehalogenase